MLSQRHCSGVLASQRKSENKAAADAVSSHAQRVAKYCFFCSTPSFVLFWDGLSGVAGNVKLKNLKCFEPVDIQHIKLSKAKTLSLTSHLIISLFSLKVAKVTICLGWNSFW